MTYFFNTIDPLRTVAFSGVFLYVLLSKADLGRRKMVTAHTATRTIFALVAMAIVIAVHFFWPHETGGRVVSSLLIVHLLIALKLAAVFLIGGLVAGFVARQPIIFPTLALWALYWTVMFILVFEHSPLSAVQRFIDLLSLNYMGLLASGTASVIGVFFGAWLFGRYENARRDAA